MVGKFTLRNTPQSSSSSHTRLCPPHWPGLESGAVSFCFVFFFSGFCFRISFFAVVVCVTLNSASTIKIHIIMNIKSVNSVEKEEI